MIWAVWAAEGARTVDVASSQMEFWDLLAYAGDTGPVEGRELLPPEPEMEWVTALCLSSPEQPVGGLCVEPSEQ